MSKIGIVLKREYLSRVTKKSFIILTLLIPFLAVGLIAVPLWLSTIKSDKVKNVAIIDNTGKYLPLFSDTENYHFFAAEKSAEEYRNDTNSDVFAILSITDDLLENPKAAAIYSSKQIPVDLSTVINRTITPKIQDDKLATYDIPNLKEIIADSKVSFSIQTIKYSQDGTEKKSSSHVASIIGMALTFIIYMFILLYGNMVMQGVMEEKTNRIIEVIISSVKPFELMMGKVLGILLVGLTQLFSWAVILLGAMAAFGYYLQGNIDPELLQQSTSMMNPELIQAQANVPGLEIYQALGTINWVELLSMTVVFFIGGFLLYASLFAAIGSAIEHPEDAQQFMTPITILFIFAIYAGIYSINNPDGPLAFWCSLIPLTSPIVMMVRLPFDVPIWELIVSIVLLFGSAIGIVWLAAKIYRVGILMYGKKPSIQEMIKWVRYK